MKVIFIPYDRKGNNPYQKLLMNHLQDLGVEIEGNGTYRIFSLLRSTFSHWKPDILHLHWHHPFLLGTNVIKTIVKSLSFIAELLILKLVEVKIVWTVHNIASHEEKFKLLELFFTKYLAQLCNKIIVHGPSAKKEVIKIYRSRESQIVVIPHGNYINYYKNIISKIQAKNKLQFKTEEIVFLCFGMIRPYKGVPELIDAFKKLNYPQTKLLIVGKPFNYEIANEIREKCRGDKNIKLVFKFIPDDEIQTYMNAADVIVLPYRDILTSGSVILAMSFGKPIIAPAIGCILDVLDNKGGFLYNPSEKEGLLKAMKQALDANLKEMGEYNLELAKQLRWDDIAKRTYEVYQECLRGKR